MREIASTINVIGHTVATCTCDAEGYSYCKFQIHSNNFKLSILLLKYLYIKALRYKVSLRSKLILKKPGATNNKKLRCY